MNISALPFSRIGRFFIAQSFLQQVEEPDTEFLLRMVSGNTILRRTSVRLNWVNTPLEFYIYGIVMVHSPTQAMRKACHRLPFSNNPKGISYRRFRESLFLSGTAGNQGNDFLREVVIVSHGSCAPPLFEAVHPLLFFALFRSGLNSRVRKERAFCKAGIMRIFSVLPIGKKTERDVCRMQKEFFPEKQNARGSAGE